MPDWTGPYRESQRKSDRYMPAEARFDEKGHGLETAGPNEAPPAMRLAEIESSVQKYIRAGARGQDLVVAVSNSTGFNLATVAQWIQRNRPELKRKSKEALRAGKKKKKRKTQ